MFNRIDTRSMIHPKRYNVQHSKCTFFHVNTPSITHVVHQSSPEWDFKQNSHPYSKSHVQEKLYEVEKCTCLHGGRGTFFDAIKIGRVKKIDTKEN